MLENYAGDCLEYEEKLKLLTSEEKGSAEAEISEDGSILENATQPPAIDPPPQPLFHSKYIIDELSQVMSETSDHFFAKTGGWRVTANAARFERMLDERYGVFRPFITKYPGIEHFVRSVQRKYAVGYFSPFRQGSPPIPRSTAIVILFLMYRGSMRWEIMVLSVLFFLVGLQPWALVSIIVLIQFLFNRRKRRPRGSMKSSIPLVKPYYQVDPHSSTLSTEDSITRKYQYLELAIGEPLDQNDIIDTANFDTLILGYGPACLYAASLLSRAGRKVLVLSSCQDASGCLTLEYCRDAKTASMFKSVPFDVEASNVAKVSMQQEILAPALRTTTDLQGGIRFVQIGSDADGHAFEVLSIPGMGAEDASHEIPFILKSAGGPRAIMEEAAMTLGDGFPALDGSVGESTVGAYMLACETMNTSSSLFYLSKLLPDSINNLRSSSTYQDSAIRYASSFLNKCFPLNPHTRSLMAGIGMRGENIRPSAASMAVHVTNVCAATSGEGMHYPIGGPRAICRAFANVIERSGGRIVTNVQMKELLFDESSPPDLTTTKPDEGPPPPRCIGVKLEDGREVRFALDRCNGNNRSSKPEPAIISFEGFIDTFVRLLPDDIRTKYKVPRGLPALAERRPVFKVLFALEGSAQDLEVTGADYYRLPNASIAKDEYDSNTGTVTQGEIGGTDESFHSEEEQKDIVESTNEDGSSETVKLAGDAGGERRGKKSRRRCKFDAGVSWLSISFPSAKDPSFEARHGKITTCVVTIEADDDFVTAFDTKPKLYSINKPTAATSGELERLLERVKKDLVSTYPQVEGRIRHSELRGPYRRGLSHSPERFAAKGVRPQGPYPHLFIGGSDLTVGESFSAAMVGGWLAANAVVGYDFVDYLFLGKNVTSDLEQFLENPDLPETEDLAVPLVETPSANSET